MKDLGSVKLRIYSPTGKSESVRPEPTRDSLGPASSNPGSDTSFSETTGPISFSTYMQMCLSHPTDGYYTNPAHAVFGSKGDFITSPEISQVFGEVFEHFPAGRAAVNAIHLVETSNAMQRMQEERLQSTAKKYGWDVQWHSSLQDVAHDTQVYTMVLAHEFFDALPFHLLEKTKEGWNEVLIASVPDPTAPKILKSSPSLPDNASENIIRGVLETSPRFRQVLSRSPTVASSLLGTSSPRFQKLPVGSRVEISPSAFKIAHRIGELLHSHNGTAEDVAGCALIVDYGGEKAYGSSFRAFKDHKIVDVFHRPGECDLTTNVDFAYLKDAIADLGMFGCLSFSQVII
ncbi:hypothetical protein PHLCEN_2v1407 [Hermanssonia centrifuga]|uniref:Protein arginine methyltransferase NDUFAF7 n=1 Tax=Hermanssonia centrifuga TaxID=98765 RepID=A0A2R6S3B5_9APHY|nr:hypothetical protein PHLCEN_2v1407 [Hermanssonia centrifuga]